jgi:hypothetical protein
MSSAGSSVRVTVQVVVVFAALTAAAVVLVTISAYSRNDGAAALGYLGGGMFGAALTYILLTLGPYRSSPAGTGAAAADVRSPEPFDPRR